MRYLKVRVYKVRRVFMAATLILSDIPFHRETYTKDQFKVQNILLEVTIHIACILKLKNRLGTRGCHSCQVPRWYHGNP